jgi:CubicO group peptidase (beta-lactamase class C family)
LVIAWLLDRRCVAGRAETGLRPAATPALWRADKGRAREELREIDAPGAAIGIVSGGRLVFARGAGISDVETGAPMTPDLLFRLGSTTKMFTAAAPVMLAEEGRLKLDEPIGTVVQGLHPRLAAVTAHLLLSHTSGILAGRLHLLKRERSVAFRDRFLERRKN